MPLEMYDSNKNSSPIQHVIAIAAGKGGVGKSTLTVNLALALKQLGFTVGILDADIYGPSIRKMLPEDRLPTQRDPWILPAHCQGIRMISMSYFRKENEAAAVRAPIANSVITQFIKNVQWGSLDFLLIDFPPGTGDIQLTLSQQSNLTCAVMVTTPQEVSLLDVRKAMHMFEQVQIPILGIVENMSYFVEPTTLTKQYLFGKEGGKKLAAESGAPLLGSIPIDPLICQCGDDGKSIFTQPQALKETLEAFLSTAEKVASHARSIKEESNKALTQFELVWRNL